MVLNSTEEFEKYIRSVGYNGFDEEDEGGSGFMMFSGSVSKSLNTSQSYNGVGIELIGKKSDLPSGSRFLKFRTSGSSGGSEFEVKTDTFLFGIKGVKNNYIKLGSNGNLEISYLILLYKKTEMLSLREQSRRKSVEQ